ncbi:MAG: hypothetical protein PHI98_08855 [Eubacteriales bacterium]|nr:hypothetical protein [Eubacteriales bacterium]
MPEERKLWTRLPQWLAALAGVFLCGVLLLLVFFQSSYEQYYRPDTLLANALLLGIAVFLTGAGLWLWVKKSCRPTAVKEEHALRRKELWLLCGAYLLLFGLQCLVARCVWFYVGFDPSNVRLYSLALVTGDPIDVDYFQQCANNAPITVLLALPCYLGVKLGLAEPYVLEVYFSVMVVNLSCFLTMICICRFSQSRGVHLFAFLLSTVMILFSPYITMPYTDTFAMLFPVLALLVITSRWKAPVRYGFASLCCSVGGAIKPSAFIMLIAILLLGCFRALGRPTNGGWKRLGITALAIIVGFLPGRIFQSTSTTLLAGSAKPEPLLDSAHYLMIGLDDQYWGGHSVEGLAFSQSISSLSDRNAANLQAAWKHVADRTVRENLYFFSVKAYKAYADGTFAWNGSALMDSVPKRTDGLSTFLRSIYYRQGALNPAYCTAMQCLWLLTLLLCAVGALMRRKERSVQLIALALLGLSGYQLLFEVWPRYLLLYAPLFVLLASLGLEELRNAAMRRLHGANPSK